MDLNFIVLVTMALLCLYLLVAFLRLKKELRQLHHQVQYQKDTKSTFASFTESNDPDIKVLRQTIQDLRKMYEEEQIKRVQADQRYKELITNVSHDIRTPLTSIQGYLQLMEGCTCEETRMRYLAVIQSRTSFLKELLNELFLYTKITSDGFELQYEKLYPCELLSQLILAYHQEFLQHQIQCEISYEQESLAICSDRYCMERIFTNLISNILKHGKGACQIIQKAEGDHVQFSFVNACIEPMSTHQAEQLFDRFYVQDHTMNQNNSGIGLAVVKALVEKLHGSITAQVIQDKLVLTMSLPLHLS